MLMEVQDFAPRSAVRDGAFQGYSLRLSLIKAAGQCSCRATIPCGRNSFEYLSANSHWYVCACAGYRVSGSHANPLGLKTDAPPEVFWDVMRCWVLEHPTKKASMPCLSFSWGPALTFILFLKSEMLPPKCAAGHCPFPH